MTLQCASVFTQGGAEGRDVEVNQSWVALAKGAFCQIWHCNRIQVSSWLVCLKESSTIWWSRITCSLLNCTPLQPPQSKSKPIRACTGSSWLLSKLTLQPSAIFSSATLFTYTPLFTHNLCSVLQIYILNTVSGNMLDFYAPLVLHSWCTCGWRLEGTCCRVCNTGKCRQILVHSRMKYWHCSQSWFLHSSQRPHINCHKRVVEGNMKLCSDLRAKSNVLKKFIKRKVCCKTNIAQILLLLQST